MPKATRKLIAQKTKEIEAQSLSIMCRKEGADGVELVDVGAVAYKQAINQMELASKSGSAAVDVLLLGKEGEVDSSSGVGGGGAAAKTEVVVEAAAVEGAPPSEGEMLGGGPPALDEQYRKLWRANGEKA